MLTLLSAVLFIAVHSTAAANDVADDMDLARRCTYQQPMHLELNSAPVHLRSAAHTPISLEPIEMRVSMNDLDSIMKDASSQLYPRFAATCADRAGFFSELFSVLDCIADLQAQTKAWLRAGCAPVVYQPSPSTEWCSPRSGLEVAAPAPDDSAAWSKILAEIILPQRLNSTWASYYLDVADFIRARYPNPMIVEVGTAFGGLGNRLLGELPTANLFAVDPFLAGYDPLDGQSALLERWAAEQGLGRDAFSLAWAHALAADQAGQHGCRYHLFRRYSADAAEFFPDGSLDVVFVDGLHTYEGVSTDILAWGPKLRRPGGSFIFNDLGFGMFPGVDRAVDDFVRIMGLGVVMGALGVPPGIANGAVVLP